MAKTTDLQSAFIEVLCKEQVPVSVFLMSGIKLHGVIDAHDEHMVMLKNAITQMVYKHAISTIVPSKTLV